MIRKTLYMATSLAVLMSAAQAQAADIVGSGVFSTVTSSDIDGAYKLAEELTFYTAYSSATAAAATQGVVTFELAPTDAFTLNEPLLLTVDLSGGVFTSSTGFSAATVITATGYCQVASVTAVTPIARNATTAQYLVVLEHYCTGPASRGIALTAPVQVTGSNMTIGAKLEQSFGGQRINVDGGRASARFVTVEPAFSAEVEPENRTITALVAEGYHELDGPIVTASNVHVLVDTGVNIDLAGNAASGADIAGVDMTATALTGSFTGFNLASDDSGSTTLFSSASSTATLSTVRVFSHGGGELIDEVFVVDNTSTATTAGINADAVIPATTFSLLVAVDLDDDLRDFSVTGSMTPITRDGASFVAPWIALGAASASSTIRLANNGSTDTGPIQMTLTSSNGSAATTETVTIGAGQLVSGSLNASGGIPAGGVVSISGAALKTAFGTNAANGDLEISIEAQPQFISGKVRVTQASGQVFETSLGNLQGDY